MPKKKEVPTQRFSEFVAKYGLRHTARLFGHSPDWVLARYHYTVHFKRPRLIKYIEGPATIEKVFPKYAEE